MNKKPAKKLKPRPLAESLAGVIPEAAIPDKNDYINYLEEKYS
ncbi:MAG: hypothetical protein ACXWEY_04870 [Bacteroidia bacterium]